MDSGGLAVDNSSDLLRMNPRQMTFGASRLTLAALIHQQLELVADTYTWEEESDYYMFLMTGTLGFICIRSSAFVICTLRGH
jgi:hypothetical protein